MRRIFQVPFLQAFFSSNCVFDVIELREVDQTMDTVLAGESWYYVRAMLIDSSDQIVRHTDVQRAANVACKNIDPVATHHVSRRPAAGFSG
jgi:hypothetical protein